MSWLTRTPNHNSAHPTKRVNSCHYLRSLLISRGDWLAGGAGLSWIWVASTYPKLGRVAGAGAAISLGLVAHFIPGTRVIYGDAPGRFRWRRREKCLRSQTVQ